MNSRRRYEILVPLLFNSGEAVPRQLLRQTFKELRKRFGAATWETQTLRGAWEHEGEVYEDTLARFFVDVPDTPENLAHFRDYKAVLKTRFRQLDIWITSHPLDVI
jgi:hypothetical protein